MAAAIPAAIGGVLNLVGSTRPRTATQTSESKSSQTGVLTGRQNKIDKGIFKGLKELLGLGTSVSQGDRNTMRTQVNRTAAGSMNQVGENLAARGYGRTGKMGRAATDIAINRNNAIQSGEAALQASALQRLFQTLGLGMQFNTPRTINQTSSSTSTGTMPGQNPYSAIGSGMSDLSTALYMNKLMGAASTPINAPILPVLQFPELNTQSPYSGIPCWIAMALYGETSWRVDVLRAWLAEQAAQHLRWRMFVCAYRLVGGLVARRVRGISVLRTGMRSYFDGLLARALTA